MAPSTNGRSEQQRRASRGLLDAAAEAIGGLRDAVVRKGKEDLSFEYSGVFGLVQVGRLTDDVELMVVSCVTGRVAEPDDALLRWIVERSDSLLLGGLVLSSSPDGGTELLLRYAFPASGLDRESVRVVLFPVLAAAVDVRTQLAAR